MIAGRHFNRISISSACSAAGSYHSERRVHSVCNGYGKQVLLALKQRPSSIEVVRLNNLFPEPHKLIQSLLKDIIKFDSSCMLEVKVETCLNGLLWRATVQFNWPHPFTTTGVSLDRGRAECYAYLQACEVFQTIGLISSGGTVVDFRAELKSFIDQFTSKSVIQTNACLEGRVDGHRRWQSILDFSWPFEIHVIGHGRTRKAAETSAIALAFLTLKCRKLLERPKCSVRSPITIQLPKLKDYDEVQPDYEMWVDASKSGFGAYLICRSGPDYGTPTRWLREEWPTKVHKLYIESLHQSTLAEFYAVVCAVYTWKKKFSGRSVVVWSDSKNSVTMIDNGLRLKPYPTVYDNLYRTLYDTCLRYNIQLHARHINRCYNKAADSLAKLDMDSFREMVPDAAPRAKKSKKLLFIRPLTHLETVQNSFPISPLTLS